MCCGSDAVPSCCHNGNSVGRRLFADEIGCLLRRVGPVRQRLRSIRPRVRVARVCRGASHSAPCRRCWRLAFSVCVPAPRTVVHVVVYGFPGGDPERGPSDVLDPFVPGNQRVAGRPKPVSTGGQMRVPFSRTTAPYPQPVRLPAVDARFFVRDGRSVGTVTSVFAPSVRSGRILFSGTIGRCRPFRVCAPFTLAPLGFSYVASWLPLVFP